jgi:hypothetical protein
MLNFVVIKFMNLSFSYHAYELAEGTSKSSSTGFHEHPSVTRRVLTTSRGDGVIYVVTLTTHSAFNLGTETV